MKFVLNGAIVQGKQETNYLNIPKVKYTGIHAYYHDPLSDVADIDLRRIADQAMIKKYNDGTCEFLNFITEPEVLFAYINACQKANIEIRVLFLKSNYDGEKWNGEIPENTFLGYEYCEIPFDSQIITDFDWHPSFSRFYQKLNNYGLFQIVDDVIEFKRAYNTAFEKGLLGDGEMDAFVCEVCEVDIEKFLRNFHFKRN